MTLPVLMLLLAGAPQGTPDVPQWIDPNAPPKIDVSSLLTTTKADNLEAPPGMLEAGSSERPSLRDPGRAAYSLTLFLDEIEARATFQRYAGRGLAGAVADPALHRTLRDPRLKRALVLRVAPGMTGADVAQELRASLKRVTSLTSAGASSFLRCFRSDLKEGDEVTLKSDGGGSLAIGYRNAGCVTLVDPNFTRDLLSIWIDGQRDSGQPNGLLSKCGGLIR